MLSCALASLNPGYTTARMAKRKAEIKDSCVLLYVVITQDEYDIFVITRVRGEAEDEC